MEKIKMITPLVEMDGDEMTRILWKIIKDELINPFIDLKSEYYDLGLEESSIKWEEKWDRKEKQIYIQSNTSEKRLMPAAIF